MQMPRRRRLNSLDSVRVAAVSSGQTVQAGAAQRASMPKSIPCRNTGAEDDGASPQGGPATTAREPQTVVVTMEVTPDHRDEDIRTALSRFAGGREVHILRGGGDSLRSLESMLRSNADPGKCIEPNMTSQYDVPDRPVLCIDCGIKSVLYVKEPTKFSFSEIQAATSNFSKENLLGEGEFGHVYKGQLKDGQVIAAKLRKKASSQGYTEFLSEVQVHSFARHRNIIMLLGYCSEESYNILVYEYICNNSLEWHLFDKSASLLVWHKRHAIAIGMAKGLHFLHAECRPGPIIHRDLHPSNVLLTHGYFPMLGNFARAKWKAGSASTDTRILERSGYLAPEYAECRTISVKSDVYSFGILLFQLISGRKVFDDRGGHILQWAEPLFEILALHELVDDRIKDTYDTYGLYRLAKAAYLCVRRNSEQRPSMGEVVRLIEVEDDHIRDFSRQFIPKLAK